MLHEVKQANGSNLLHLFPDGVGRHIQNNKLYAMPFLTDDHRSSMFWMKCTTEHYAHLLLDENWSYLSSKVRKVLVDAVNTRVAINVKHNLVSLGYDDEVVGQNLHLICSALLLAIHNHSKQKSIRLRQQRGLVKKLLPDVTQKEK